MTLAHDVQGSGPLVVLVHGITENRHSWDPLTDHLAADHRVLRVDLRGHGESAFADTYSPAELAADINPLVDEPALIIGHSLGGLVATAYAGAFPVRGVINVDQSLDLGGLQAQVQSVAPLLRSDAFPDVMAGLFESLRGQTSDDEWKRLTALRRPDQSVALGIWSVMIDSDAGQLESLVRELTGAVTAPYLALDGIDPGEGHSEWLRERIPQAALEVWEGVGHYPHLVHPERFLARVRAFESEL